MRSIELNPDGNFTSWQPHLIKELKQDSLDSALGQKLIFENDRIKLWEVTLLPKQRMPFRKINCNYNFHSMTDGTIITRSGTGKICLTDINIGDSKFMPMHNSESIRDLENIGSEKVIFQLTEFKSTKSALGQVFNLN